VGVLLGKLVWKLVSENWSPSVTGCETAAPACNERSDGQTYGAALPIGKSRSSMVVCNRNEHSQREQTSANAYNLNEKWSGIRIQISGLIRIRMSSDRSQNVGDWLRCRLPLFRQVSWQSAGDCMTNANISSTITYSTMMRKRESDPESVSGTGAPPNVNQFFRLIGPIITSGFNEIRWLLLQ